MMLGDRTHIYVGLILDAIIIGRKNTLLQVISFCMYLCILNERTNSKLSLVRLIMKLFQYLKYHTRNAVSKMLSTEY